MLSMRKRPPAPVITVWRTVSIVTTAPSSGFPTLSLTTPSSTAVRVARACAAVSRAADWAGAMPAASVRAATNETAATGGRRMARSASGFDGPEIAPKLSPAPGARQTSRSVLADVEALATGDLGDPLHPPSRPDDLLQVGEVLDLDDDRTGGPPVDRLQVHVADVGPRPGDGAGDVRVEPAPVVPL